MPNPAWFNETYYAEQKVAQMNATSYEMGAGEWLPTNGGGATQWTVELYNQYLAQYTLPGTQQAVTAYQNFEACNGADYAASITLADVNVSPNQYFNVNEYLQALADYNNANPDAYEGSAPAGGWTVANELSTIFNTYHSSVWNHYDANWDTLQLDPSNAFDTSAYLEARAEAMGNGATVADAIAAIKGAGLNPVQDFFIFGAEHNISATPVSTPLTPVLPDGGWTVWGEPVTPPAPEDTDPFEQNVTNVAMTAGQTTYPGEGETYSGNTQFDATWIPSSANSTLSAKDVITGPENTYNTLSVTLGKNWTGFSGVKQEDGTVAPSVTNVGRVELIHNPANSEASWTFDAKNISEDAYRFDLVGADGPGAISLSNLSDAVSEIRISDLQPKDVSKNSSKAPDTTNINFVTGANSGKDDALTLVVENVGAAGKDAAIVSKNFGIEELTVQANKGDAQSYVDLSGLTGVKTLKVTGDGNIQISDVATGITTYDASAATGNVDMAVVSPRASTVVKGGSGYDTVSLTQGGSWTPASLENVEGLALFNNETVNLTNVEAGLTDLWGLANGGTLKNLTADNFTVHLASKSGAVTVNGDKEGSLINLTYATPAEEGKQMTGQLSTNATGTIKFDIGEGVTAFATGAVTADNATELVVNSGGSTTIGKGTQNSMKSMQDVTLNLENSSTTGTDLSQLVIDLPSAENVTVNAGGQNVQLQNLGTVKNDSSITLDVNESYAFTVGNIQTSVGCTIDVNIEAEYGVSFGNISNSTTQLAGGEGDLQLVVAAKAVSSNAVDNSGNTVGATIQTGPMNIDFSNVEGDAFASGKELTLDSQGTITYLGAQGKDYLIIDGVETGSSSSSIALGDGADTLTFTNGVVGSQGLSTITVDLDEGAAKTDTIAINGQDTVVGAKLLINLENFDAKGTNKDVIEGAYTSAITENTVDGNGDVTATSSDTKALADILEDFGIVSNTAGVAEGITKGACDGTFIYDDNVYAVDSLSDTTVLICIGSAEDVNQDGILSA